MKNILCFVPAFELGIRWYFNFYLVGIFGWTYRWYSNLPSEVVNTLVIVRANVQGSYLSVVLKKNFHFGAECSSSLTRVYTSESKEAVVKCSTTDQMKIIFEPLTFSKNRLCNRHISGGSGGAAKNKTLVSSVWVIIR